MKAWLKKLAGANREKVIVVIAVTRADAEAGIQHARTSAAAYPVWVWCSEPGDAPAPCDRYSAVAGTAQIVREMHRIWPALSITGWTGRRLNTAVLAPFLFLPLRIVIFNEFCDFAAGRPSFVARHLLWRMRVALKSGAICVGEWVHFAAVKWPASIAYRTGERLRDAILWIWNFVLAITALCAPAIAAFSYKAMRRQRGGTSSAVEMPRARSADCERIEVSARAWRRRRFLGALNGGTTPYVAIHRGPVDQADLDDLLQLAFNANAFAVARQEAFTDGVSRFYPNTRSARCRQAKPLPSSLRTHR